MAGYAMYSSVADAAEPALDRISSPRAHSKLPAPLSHFTYPPIEEVTAPGCRTWFPMLLLVVACLLAPVNAVGARTELAGTSPSELKKLSIEQLLELEVTTASRRPEKLTETASAIQVITEDDIHRSGASSLPQALRLAPNLQVARVDSRQWGISSRGFNQPGLLANKLLVMIDGRTIYTPLYAGVFWDVQHVLLEDVEQIEVVSGPGGALWGANAVNGVINVETKSARETQSALVTAGGGSLLQDFAAARYGFMAGTNLFARVYGLRFDHRSTDLFNGDRGDNAWDVTQGGFRMDWQASDHQMLTLQGDLYGGTIAQPGPDDVTVDGQNLLGRWTHTVSEESDIKLQIYFDRTWRRIPNTFAEDLRTYDVDFQHRFPLGNRQSFMWGVGYRFMDDDVRNGPVIQFLPGEKTLDLFSGFVQDEFSLVPKKLRFTLGAKLEHNDYSGLEFQPSARLAWLPNDVHTVWSAVSRAVRSPSRIDVDVYLPLARLAGGPNFDSEKLTAYELGYRIRPTEELSLSLATFFHNYDDLRSTEQVDTFWFELLNGLEAESWGVEFSGRWLPTAWWRLRGGFTAQRIKVFQAQGHVDRNQGRLEGYDPQNQCLIQSTMDLPGKIELDVVGRYVDRLAVRPTPNLLLVPSYVTFDVRIARRFQNFELAIIGQNLAERRKLEFGYPMTIPRSIYGKITWEY